MVDRHGVDCDDGNQDLVKHFSVEKYFIDKGHDVEETRCLIYPEIMNVLGHVVEKGRYD